MSDNPVYRVDFLRRGFPSHLTRVAAIEGAADPWEAIGAAVMAGKIDHAWEVLRIVEVGHGAVFFDENLWDESVCCVHRAQKDPDFATRDTIPRPPETWEKTLRHTHYFCALCRMEKDLPHTEMPGVPW